MNKQLGVCIGGACVVSALVIGACTPRKNHAGMPLPTSKMARESGKPIDTLGKGYSLFQQHCAQCHELVIPKHMRVQQWHAVAPGMAWNVGLNKEDEQSVISYLDAAMQPARKSGDDAKKKP